MEGIAKQLARIRKQDKDRPRKKVTILGAGMAGLAAAYEWTGGAFSFLRPGDHPTYYRDAIGSEGRLYFAGEHCSLDQAWIQGALISSLRAVEEIVAAEA